MAKLQIWDGDVRITGSLEALGGVNGVDLASVAGGVSQSQGNAVMLQSVAAALASEISSINTDISDITDNKIQFFFQDSDPSSGWDAGEQASNTGDIWYDTNASPKRLQRWNGSSWDTADDLSLDAFNNAATAQSTADSKIVTFYQDAEPSGAGEDDGDLWVDTNDGNRMYRYDGAEWDDVHDAAIDQALSDAATAISDAATAQGTADGKVTTFYQDAEPSGAGEDEGDLWIDTNDGNKLYRYNGSTWDEIQDADIATAISNAATAQSTADSKIVTFYQDAEPSGAGEDDGDLWVDTNDGNKLYRYNGASWVEIQDADISTAISNAATAQSTADSKIVTFYQDAAPSGVGEDDGDLWVDTNDGNKLYRYNGSSWVDADRLQDGVIIQAMMAAENFFFTKAIGGQNRGTPQSGDVRSYLGKDPLGDQADDDPVGIGVLEYNGDDWESRLLGQMRTSGNVADLFVSGFFEAGEAVLSAPGLIWRSVTNPFSSEQVSRVAYGNEVLVSVTDAGAIARSTDGGESWSTVTDPFGSTAIYDVKFGNDVFIACGTGEKLARSTDDGATWGSLVTMPTTSTCTLIAIAYGNGVWVVGGGQLTGDAELARSTNDGVSWSLVTNPFGTGNRCFGMATDGAGTWIATSEAGEIARSTDDGASFSTVTSPFGSTLIRTVKYGGGVFIAAGNSGKLARSTDAGATWSSLIDAGFGTSLIIDLAYGEGIWVATGEDGTITRSTDGGLTWGDQVYGDGSVQHPFGTSGYISGVVYAEDLRLFCAVGDDSSGSGDPLIAVSEWLEAGSGIIEQGENSNGHYVRFSSGLQICFGAPTTATSINQVWGNIYIHSATPESWTFPAAFTRVIGYSGFSNDSAAGAASWLMNVSLSTSSTNYFFCRGPGDATSRTHYARLMAIGFWK